MKLLYWLLSFFRKDDDLDGDEMAQNAEYMYGRTTIYRCDKHGGIGFQSDCIVCKRIVSRGE